MPRGRPKGSFSSDLSLLLLLLLRESPSETWFLSGFLHMPSKTIAVYLSNLRRMGYVDRNGPVWHITEKGLARISMWEQNNRQYNDIYLRYKNIVESRKLYVNNFLTKKIRKNSKEIRKNYKYDKSLEQVIDILSSEKNEKLVSISSIIRDRIGRELDETEYTIIKWIVEMTEKMKRKYLLVPQQGMTITEYIAEETGLPMTSVENALRFLEANGIVWMTYDNRRGVQKIRLDRSLEVRD